MANTLTTQERRASQRIRAVHLSATLRRKSFMRRRLRRRDAAVLDFSRQGIALCTDNRFRVGDKVELQLQSYSEHITGIQGTVRYVCRERGEYSLGIEFDASCGNKRGSRAASNILDCMEKVVEHQLA